MKSDDEHAQEQRDQQPDEQPDERPGHRRQRGTTARVAALSHSDGGVPKRQVPETLVTARGMDGDRQRNLKFHGGPDRALCLYALERIAALQREGHPILPGSTGENVTVEGLDWSRVAPGSRLRLGEVMIEVTAYTTPCRTIRGSFADRDSTRISHERHPGWSRVYARVIRPGLVRVGDPVELFAATARAAGAAR